MSLRMNGLRDKNTIILWRRACSQRYYRSLRKGSLRKESLMLTKPAKHKHRWIGALAILVSYFTVSPMVAPLLAQTTILGELTFKGASKVEKTSGVWID